MGAGQRWVGQAAAPLPSPRVSLGPQSCRPAGRGGLWRPGWQREGWVWVSRHPTGPSRWWGLGLGAGPLVRPWLGGREGGRAWDGCGVAGNRARCTRPGNVLDSRAREGSAQPGSRGPFLDLLSTPEKGAARGHGPAALFVARRAGGAEGAVAGGALLSACLSSLTVWLASGPRCSPSRPASGCPGPLLKDGVMGAQRGSPHSPAAWGLF